MEGANNEAATIQKRSWPITLCEYQASGSEAGGILPKLNIIIGGLETQLCTSYITLLINDSM